MIDYIAPRPPSTTKSICPAVKSDGSFISAPTSKQYDDIRKDVTVLNVAQPYRIWPGATSDVHAFYDYSVPSLDGSETPVYLPPTITTFYGHDLIAPYGVTITPYATSRKIQLVLLTLHRADQDDTREVTVAAWQGDNDTFHLVQPLTDEDPVFGPVKHAIFGRPNDNAEKRDWMLSRLYYGDTAVLDVDIAQIITPGKIFRA